MQSQELYHLIELQPEIVQRLQRIGEEVDLKRMDSELTRLTDRETASQAYRDMQPLLGDDTDHMKMLYCQLEGARRIHERYLEKRIAEDIYIDTMKCFTRFIGECGKKNGRLFFDRGWWTYRQVSMALFRIGALEYEFHEYKGEKVIGLHIPSDANMSKEAVDCSLDQAARFFNKHFPEYKYDKYICDSWLLSPALKPMLSERSNILSFQERFTIVQEKRSDREFIEWLFQVPEDTDYHNLPEETGLQRKVKELLLRGGTVGTACGIMG